MIIPRLYRVEWSQCAQSQLKGTRIVFGCVLWNSGNVMWILTGLHYLFEQGKEKSHLIEVILKTFLTRLQTLNRFQP